MSDPYSTDRQPVGSADDARYLASQHPLLLEYERDRGLYEASPDVGYNFDPLPPPLAMGRHYTDPSVVSQPPQQHLDDLAQYSFQLPAAANPLAGLDTMNTSLIASAYPGPDALTSSLSPLLAQRALSPPTRAPADAATSKDEPTAGILAAISARKGGASDGSTLPKAAGDDDGDDPEETAEDEKPLHWSSLLRFSFATIPVQAGWAVEETVILPYLLAIGVKESIANLMYLINPIVSLCIQPLVATWCDRCTSRWGRRKPFLLAFHIGILIGYMLIAFGEELVGGITGSPVGRNHPYSIGLTVLIFIGVAFMNLSDDFMLIPSRALLNDKLPAPQLEHGNAFFGFIQALGGLVGLGITMLPLEDVPPFSLVPGGATHLQCSFLALVVVAIVSMVVTLTVAEEPLSDEQEKELEEEEKTPPPLSFLQKVGSMFQRSTAETREDENTSGQKRLFSSQRTSAVDDMSIKPRQSYGYAPLRDAEEDVIKSSDSAARNADTSRTPLIQVQGRSNSPPTLLSLLSGGAGTQQSSEPDTQTNGTVMSSAAGTEQGEHSQSPDGDERSAGAAAPEEAVTSEGETEENEGFFADLINSFRTLPARSLQLWVVQFSWWAAVLNMGVWWTSWVGIEVYGGDPDSKDPHLTSLFDHGVWVGTLGILLQSAVGLLFAHLLPYFNMWWGVAPVYHIGCVIYALLAISTYYLKSFYGSLLVQVLIGVVYPIINVNPYILLTHYDAEAASEGESEEEEEAVPADAPLESVLLHSDANDAATAEQQYQTPYQSSIHDDPHALLLQPAQPIKLSASPVLQAPVRDGPSLEADEKSVSAFQFSFARPRSTSQPSSHAEQQEYDMGTAATDLAVQSGADVVVHNTSSPRSAWRTRSIGDRHDNAYDRVRVQPLASTQPVDTSTVVEGVDEGDADGDGEDDEAEETGDPSSYYAAHAALMNMSMTAAQILVGGTTGILVEKTGDITYAFLVYGNLLLLVNFIVGILAVRRWVCASPAASSDEAAAALTVDASSGEAGGVSGLRPPLLSGAAGRSSPMPILSARRPPRLRVFTDASSRATPPAPGSGRRFVGIGAGPTAEAIAFQRMLMHRGPLTPHRVRHDRRPLSPRTLHEIALQRHRNRNVVRHLMRNRYYAGVLMTSRLAKRHGHFPQLEDYPNNILFSPLRTSSPLPNRLARRARAQHHSHGQHGFQDLATPPAAAGRNRLSGGLTIGAASTTAAGAARASHRWSEYRPPEVRGTNLNVTAGRTSTGMPPELGSA